MKCRICHLNETNSATGICWECMNKNYVYKKAIEKKKVKSLKRNI